jgi:hypothetical protein
MIRRAKNFLKFDQIEKLDQRQKPSKWAQLLGAGLIGRGSIYFSGPGAFFTKSFTNKVFLGIAFPSFYHLGTSCCSFYGSAKPLL